MSIRSILYAAAASAKKAAVTAVSPIISSLSATAAKTVTSQNYTSGAMSGMGGIVYTGTKYQLFAVGSNGFIEVSESTDGNTFTVNTTLSNFFTSNSVKTALPASDESGTIVVGSNGANVYVSVDFGVTYTAVAIPTTYGTNSYHCKVCYRNGVFFFKNVIDSTGYPIIYSSKDGVTWSVVSIGSGWSSTLKGSFPTDYCITFGNNKWTVLVSANNTSVNTWSASFYSASSLTGPFYADGGALPSFLLSTYGPRALCLEYLSGKYAIVYTASPSMFAGSLSETVSSDLTNWSAGTSNAWTASGLTAMPESSWASAPSLEVVCSNGMMGILIINATTAAMFGYTNFAVRYLTTTDGLSYTARGSIVSYSPVNSNSSIMMFSSLWSNVKSTFYFMSREININTGYPLQITKFFKGS